jgi:hypothetical protein
MYGTELAVNITATDIKKLDRIQSGYSRRVLGLPKKCNGLIATNELGLMSAQASLDLRRLLFKEHY